MAHYHFTRTSPTSTQLGPPHSPQPTMTNMVNPQHNMTSGDRPRRSSNSRTCMITLLVTNYFFTWNYYYIINEPFIRIRVTSPHQSFPHTKKYTGRIIKGTESTTMAAKSTTQRCCHIKVLTIDCST